MNSIQYLTNIIAGGGSPEEIANRLIDYGVMTPPFRIGDKVWVNRNKPKQVEVQEFLVKTEAGVYRFDDLNSTIFLTKSAAEEHISKEKPCIFYIGSKNMNNI